ncbi:pyruvate carboxyltransferase [Angustibacter sp. Root456]|uniref:pyruvate carboxyltransferase n=1 Tax=Angustibacter sp. Root456 TaxID=1736539 RepID=UPI0006FAB69E|nr:pyruvate carboxyltransferase [Angustibacter sp. Root456]KQX66035.1 pyruvate carboxyltransferase [Angustibacter sp. Root456]
MSRVLDLPDSVRLVEVGLRDGLQVITRPVPTSAKVRLVERLLDAGVRHVEAVSFAHPRLLPQLADAEQVMAGVPRDRGAVYRGLVPNRRGAERAAPCGLDEIVALACTDEAVTWINQRSTVADVLAGLRPIGEVARAGGARFVVGIAMAFFAPGTGRVPAEVRRRCVDAAVDAGASGVYLASSAGMDDPRDVADGVAEVRQRHPDVEVGVHLHARNGMALANALAAAQAGVTWIEGAFGGLGGDLWAPGDPAVLGNAPLEDLVHLMDGLGVTTGIDLTRYLEVVAEAMELTGATARSAVVAGGTRDELAAHRWPEHLLADGPAPSAVTHHHPMATVQVPAAGPTKEDTPCA